MQRFDLIIIGTGSGNSIITPDFDDWSIAVVEKGVFGGTCLNRGCIPSKMLVYPADIVQHVAHGNELGVDASIDGVRWSEITGRTFGRIDPIAAAGEDYRRGLDHITVVGGEGRFVNERVLDVEGELLTAPNIVIAAGARPFIAPVPGLEEVDYHTSDTIMRVPQVPERLVILGGGFIAAELGHVFDAFGADVTFIARSEALLREQDEAVSARFTAMARQRYTVLTDTRVAAVRQEGEQIELLVSDENGPRTIVADALLVATGRVPNSDSLDVAATGVRIDEAGYIITDDQMRTSVEGVWALGDIRNPDQLKHTANADAKVVAHNLANPDDLRAIDYEPVPSAVFSNPQIARVGATEQALRDEGRPYLVTTKDYGATAYGWAMEDSTSFCKLLADPESRLLLGAHLIGPQAATLVQQLVQGIRFGLTVDEMATGQLYIHPALTEVIENALLDL